MGKHRLRIVRVAPGARRLIEVVGRFRKGGDGILTAFSDARLRAAAALLPEDSPIQKVPFGALVSQYHHRCGLYPAALAQTGMAEAAIRDACLALPDDSPFAASAAFPGLHRRLASCLKTLRKWRIGPDELEDAASQVPPRLAAKLASLASIARALDSTLDELGRSQVDRLIAESLDSEPPSTNDSDRILVLAGSDFSPSACEWIEWVSRAGASVTVVTETHGAGGRLFEGARMIEERLGAKPEGDGETDAVARRLFGEGSEAPSDFEATIQSASDPLAEVEWVLRGCLRDADAGIPPHRIGIFSRELEAYGPLLSASASRLGVTLRLARRGPLLGNGFARLALAALEFCASNDVRTLLPVVQSSYLALSRPIRNEVTSRVKEACTDPDRQWVALSSWAAEHAEEYPWLAALLRWRTDAVAEAASLAEWKSRLEAMIEGIGLWDRVSSAPPEVQARDGRAQTAMRRALAHEASVRLTGGDERFDLRGFASVCRKLWENEDTSIPPAESGVPVFQSGEAIEDVDSLYVVGMLEGNFPRRRAEDPILNDDELRTLSAAFPDRPKLPDSHDKAHAERDEFYRVCTAPACRLVLSYPLTEEDRDNVPAFYLAELERALDGRLTKRNLPRGTLTPDAADCLAESDKALCEALSAETVEPAQNELTTDSAKLRVQADPQQGYSPNQIRDVLECPFRFMARHRLKLPSRRSTNRWGLLSRLPQAVGLWAVENREQAIRSLEQALDAEIESHYAEMEPGERALMRSGGRRVIREWVEREFAARETWRREPGSTRLNARFGEAPLSDELPTTGGGRIRLEGVLPAVSKVGDYTVAHVSKVRSPARPRGGELQEPSDVLELGIPMMAMFDRRGGVGVEVESMRGGRTLFTLYQSDDPPSVPGNAQEGLTVVRLGKPSEFMPAVKQMLADAVRRFERAAIEARPGDYCEWCDVGELCRRSKSFGEDDSPFGEGE